MNKTLPTCLAGVPTAMIQISKDIPFRSWWLVIFQPCFFLFTQTLLLLCIIIMRNNYRDCCKNKIYPENDRANLKKQITRSISKGKTQVLQPELVDLIIDYADFKEFSIDLEPIEHWGLRFHRITIHDGVFALADSTESTILVIDEWTEEASKYGPLSVHYYYYEKLEYILHITISIFSSLWAFVYLIMDSMQRTYTPWDLWQRWVLRLSMTGSYFIHYVIRFILNHFPAQNPKKTWKKIWIHCVLCYLIVILSSVHVLPGIILFFPIFFPLIALYYCMGLFFAHGIRDCIIGHLGDENTRYDGALIYLAIMTKFTYASIVSVLTTTTSYAVLFFSNNGHEWLETIEFDLCLRETDVVNWQWEHYMYLITSLIG